MKTAARHTHQEPLCMVCKRSHPVYCNPTTYSAPRGSPFPAHPKHPSCCQDKIPRLVCCSGFCLASIFLGISKHHVHFYYTLDRPNPSASRPLWNKHLEFIGKKCRVYFLWCLEVLSLVKYCKQDSGLLLHLCDFQNCLWYCNPMDRGAWRAVCLFLSPHACAHIDTHNLLK